MFGLRNFSGWTFIAKLGNYSIEFAAGVVEEITFNITAPTPVNAAEITENLLPPKDQIIKATSLAVSSKIVEINVFRLIAGATPNMFI